MLLENVQKSTGGRRGLLNMGKLGINTGNARPTSSTTAYDNCIFNGDEIMLLETYEGI